MSARVEWTGYGPAAERLRAEINAAKGDDPLFPVTVVVPSNHIGVATRRLLASGRLGPVCDRGVGMAAVSFLTVYRLAELLGAARLAGTGRRPVSTAVIAAALRGVLHHDPGLFGPVAAHPATEEALVGAYRELRDLPDDALHTLAATSERAARGGPPLPGDPGVAPGRLVGRGGPHGGRGHRAGYPSRGEVGSRLCWWSTFLSA